MVGSVYLVQKRLESGSPNEKRRKNHSISLTEIVGSSVDAY